MKIVFNGLVSGKSSTETFEFDDSIFSFSYTEEAASLSGEADEAGILSIKDTSGNSDYFDSSWKKIKKFDAEGLEVSAYFFENPLVGTVKTRSLLYQKSTAGINSELVRSIKLGL